MTFKKFGVLACVAAMGLLVGCSSQNTSGGQMGAVSGEKASCGSGCCKGEKAEGSMGAVGGEKKDCSSSCGQRSSCSGNASMGAVAPATKADCSSSCGASKPACGGSN
jgi:hypothetical protein